MITSKDPYTLVRERAREQGLDLDVHQVQKIVGTLRIAGLGVKLVGYRERVAAEIVDEALSDPGLRTGQTKTAGTKSDQQNIVFLADKGVCPRCQDPMTHVKLSDYSPAVYCTGCRATLWKE